MTSPLEPAAIIAPVVVDIEERVAEIAAEVRGLVRGNVESALGVGRLLNEAKELLGKGAFGLWRRRELDSAGISVRTSTNYMRLADFAEECEDVFSFDLTALHAMLADGVSPVARERLKERAARGEHITRRAVQEEVRGLGPEDGDDDTRGDTEEGESSSSPEHGSAEGVPAPPVPSVGPILDLAGDPVEKPNMDVDTSKAGDEAYTPAWVLDRAREVLGGRIDLDPCTTLKVNQRHVRAREIFQKRDDGLAHKWRGTVWLNPPYSNTSAWLEKLERSWFDQDIEGAVFLVNASVEVEWFRRFCWPRTLCFPSRRLKFGSPAGEYLQGHKRPSVIGYVGAHRSRFIGQFLDVGTIVLPATFRNRRISRGLTDQDLVGVEVPE